MKNKKSKSIVLVFMTLGCLLLFNACKTTKETQAIQLQQAEKKERIKTLLDQALQYEKFSSSANFRINRGKDKVLSIDGQVRIIKDECIQVSIKMPLLGSELMRMQITPERVTIIDRYNKQYLTESIADFKQYYPVDFDYYDLEALFTNRLFITGNQTIQNKDFARFELMEDPFNAYLNYRDRQGISYTFKSDYTHRILETDVRTKNPDVNVKWAYSDFKPASNKHLFPMKERIDLTSSKGELQLNINFKSVDVNSEFTIDYKIPSKYTRVDFNQFMKMIKSLLQ